MIIAGGIGGGKVQGQEGQLRAVAVVLEHPSSRQVRHRGLRRAVRHRCHGAGRGGRNYAPLRHSPRSLLVNATHTHSAPSTVRVHGYGPEPEFVKSVIDGIIRAVEQADEHGSTIAALPFAWAEENTVGANSRLLLSDNTIYWIGSREDAVRPPGPFDPQLPVLAFYGPQDQIAGSDLQSFDAHDRHDASRTFARRRSMGWRRRTWNKELGAHGLLSGRGIGLDAQYRRRTGGRGHRRG